MAGFLVDGYNNNHDTVLRELTAVAQYDVAYVADTQAVNQHLACRHLAVNGNAALGQLDNTAVFTDNNVVCRHAEGFSQISMLNQVTVFTMHRHEETRTHQIVHHLDFLLAGVAGNVDAVALFIDNVRTQLVQMVDSTGNKLFVARNRCSRNNYCITGHNINLFMVIHSHTSERAHRLALTAGGDNNNLFRRIVMSFVNINQHALGNLQVTKLLGDIYNIHHAAADNCYLTVILHSSINNLLDTMYVRGEGCYNNTMLSIAELLVKGLAYHFFAGSEARALGVGAVCQQAQYTAVAVFGKFIEFHNLSVNRSVVDFEVTGVDNNTDRSSNRDSNSVGNAVVYADEIELKGTGVNLVTGFYYVQGFVAYTVFLQAAL